jgi:hypothetical protein
MPLKKTSLKTVFIILALGLFLSMLTASALLFSKQTILTSGRIVSVNVGVYQNSGCTLTATAIDWGNLNAGDNKTVSVWVKNTGTSTVTLSMNTGSWVPSNATSMLSLVWNQEKKTLTPNQVVQANLTLSVSPAVDNSIGSFSFSIVISGAG